MSYFCIVFVALYLAMFSIGPGKYLRTNVPESQTIMYVNEW